jgi:exo-beta-1,3-glucanase (GH17 family)
MVHAGVQSIGVCYGIIGSNLPSPLDVVQLYRTFGISGMRVYSVVPPTLNLLRNTGIGLILGTTNDDVIRLAASGSNAASWVQTNVKPYYPGVQIKYIAVGNELTGGATQSIIAAMRNLNNALGAAGLGAIKVSTAVRMDVLANSFPPSAAVFAQSYMIDVAHLLATTGAPLLANVYPYFAYKGNLGDIDLRYATFQPGARPVKDSGNGLVYNNLFHAMVDSMYAALEKAGAPTVRVVVSESGWPSAGGVAATIGNARAYNQGLIDHVAHGTPKKPGPIEAYLFAMFNENQKPGDATERNFGLFNPTNKAPVYPITFAGSSMAANRTRSHVLLSAGTGTHS